MTSLSINAERLLERLRQLGEIGRDESGSLTRLAASEADRQGRDKLAGWIKAAGVDLAIDRLGNMFAIWRGACRGRRRLGRTALLVAGGFALSGLRCL